MHILGNPTNEAIANAAFRRILSSEGRTAMVELLLRDRPCRKLIPKKVFFTINKKKVLAERFIRDQARIEYRYVIPFESRMKRAQWSGIEVVYADKTSDKTFFTIPPHYKSHETKITFSLSISFS